MAYDEKLAERIRTLLKGRRSIAEKKMFGGVAILFNGKMCRGVLMDELVARVGADATVMAKRAYYLSFSPHCRDAILLNFPISYTNENRIALQPAGRARRALQRRDA